MQTFYFFIYNKGNEKSLVYKSLKDCLSDGIDEFNLNKKEVVLYSFDIDDDTYKSSDYYIEDIKDITPLNECEHIITINKETYHNAVLILDYV